MCPYCETNLGGAQPRAARRRDASGVIGAGLIPSARFTTSLILLLNFALYIASMVDSGALQAVGRSDPSVWMYGEWFRLITAGFFHGGMFHILMNSWALFDLGSQVEDVYGSERLIVLYFFATVAGFLLSSSMGHFSVGSSAGIFGLIGVMIGLGLSAKSALGDQIAAAYTKWAAFGLVMSFLPGVDLWAHLGGGLTGFAIARIAGLPSAFVTRADTIWRWASYACLALTALAFGRMFLLYAATK